MVRYLAGVALVTACSLINDYEPTPTFGGGSAASSGGEGGQAGGISCDDEACVAAATACRQATCNNNALCVVDSVPLGTPCPDGYCVDGECRACIDNENWSCTDAQTTCADFNCVAAGCSNDLQDGNETDVDCGAACVPCGIGLSCNQDSDCATVLCSPEGKCKQCASHAECASDRYCHPTGACSLLKGNYVPCAADYECASDSCVCNQMMLCICWP